MLTVDEALAAILAETRPFAPAASPLAEALGLVLAEDVVSDVDSPPFDKALMDGFAVRSGDVRDGRAVLRLIEEVTAGRVPRRGLEPGDATQIMTGAPIPEGADAVVRVEDTSLADGPAGPQVHIDTQPVSPGLNILPQGTSMRRGDRIMESGRLLRPQELGALAEMGRHQVAVHRRARVGVLATGDELVPISERPGPGQIRNSNEVMLVAQLQRAGAVAVPQGIARDEWSHLRERILAGLECDVLLLSGGVSAGKLDLVPSELEAAGVRPIFHKVRMKPGKPVWFGVLDSDRPEARRYVFGLPGNPVSSMVCFELFVRTALRRLQGVEPAAPAPVRARLQSDHEARGDRPTYFPSRVEWTESGPVVSPVRWHGSADLRATVEANGTVLFPAGDRQYQTGDAVDVFVWD